MNAILIVAVTALVTIAVRFLPFAVYCLKGVDFTAWPFWAACCRRPSWRRWWSLASARCRARWSISLAEVIAVAVTALLHLWKRNTLLSIAAGTVCYMILIRTVFPI